MPLTWTLRIGPVVHRESIPLSRLPLGAGDVAYRGEGENLIRFSRGAAFFWAPSVDEPAFVMKGSVVIRGGNAEIVYRAALGPIIFMFLWFGLLIAGEVAIWFFLPERPLGLALAVLAMAIGAALAVRSTLRVEVGRLRGIALEAAVRLRDRIELTDNVRSPRGSSNRSR